MRTAMSWLMLLTVFTLPWEGEVEVPAVGQVSRLVGLLAFAAWLGTVLHERRMREPHLVHLLGLLFVVWCGLSMIWTLDGPATQGRTLTYAQLLALSLIVWESVWTLAQLRRVLIAYLAGCYVTVGSLLVGYAVQGQAAEFNGRVTTGTFHPNDVGMILALGVPIAGYLLDAPGTGWWRRVLLAAAGAYLPLAGFAVLVTGSRAALAAMLPGALYAGYLLARRRPAVAVGGLVALAALGLALLPLIPPRVILRLQQTESAVDGGGLNDRAEIWAEAVRIFTGHPVTGIGGGAFRDAAVGVNKVGHNVVLALLAELGVVGCGLFVAMVVAALVALRRAPGLLVGLGWALFSAWLFAAMLHNWEYRKQTWLVLALLIVSGALRDRPPPTTTRVPSARASRWEGP